MVDVKKKVKQLSRGISKFGTMSSQALKRASAKKQRLERDMDRVFGSKEPAMHSDTETIQAKAANSVPSRSKTMDRDGDEGVKSDKFFEKDKKEGIKPW